MRHLFLFVAIVAIIVLSPWTAAAPLVRNFDQDAVGAAPPGFSFASARQATPGQWMVRADGANRYLAHLADTSAGQGLSLAIADGASPARLGASVRIKFKEGDQVGGLVWRYRDPANFYIVSLDLQKQEIALYQVVRGTRIRLEDDEDLELDRDAWHIVRVRDDGNRIRVMLGGIGVLRSRALAVGDPGRSGIWSGGGSTVWFDDVRIEDDPQRDQ